MTEFKSWRSFLDFKVLTTWTRRYVHDQETEAFLETVLQTAHKRIMIVPSGETIWRAQLGCEEPHLEKGVLVGRRPYEESRMRPLPDRAVEGRVNPKGIPVLYLATDCGTAIAEVRPWIRSYVSIGVFKSHRELKLVNCITTKSDRIVYGMMPEEDMPKELPPESREKCVWAHIDYFFAEPVARNNNVADYASTQIIAELFKANGYDGIAYRSSLDTNGNNLTLFDLNIVKLVERKLCRVTSIKCDFEEEA